MLGLFSRRYAPFIYGVIQSAVTTGVATAIATYQLTGVGMEFVKRWLLVWAIAWLTMLPIVLLVAPVIQRAVFALTGQPAQSSASPRKRHRRPHRRNR
ncbi:MAG TPA: DUF2798 domain-containing protein [Hyphomicrobiaceae bacterium]|nr:DUF2798 domain-containing protein [Hyphomicrobiaceae bacterium]